MAVTPTIQASEARVFTILRATSAATRLSEVRVFTIYNFPSREERVSAARVLAPVMHRTDMQLSELRVFTVVRGRVENRRLRAWTYNLDGHSFYVLRLGERETLAYDLATGQWPEWSSPGHPFWRAHVGCNWLGMGAASYSNGAPTNIVAGDDVYGLLWVLDPEQGYDESPRTDRPASGFPRTVTGGVPMQMRDTVPCGAIYLTIATGIPGVAGASIRLRTSDDMGKTWLDHGAITVTPGDWGQEFAWRSLGLIRHPGRIFSIEDDGATARIGGADLR